MKAREKRIGGLQMLLLVATIGVASLVAMPKYQAFADKAKISEAVNLAGESKRKISQAFMVSGSFPRTATQADAILSATVSSPEFVSDMTIEHDGSGEKVTIKVFLHEGVVDNLTDDPQFIYMAANRSKSGKYVIEWHCGGSGLSLELMPENCKG